MEYSIAKFSTGQCPVMEYSVCRVSLFLANATPSKTCGVSYQYHRKPQAFPYKLVPMMLHLQWCCMEIISLCFERVTPLGFLACHHKSEKMADGGAATVRTVYSLIKCLSDCVHGVFVTLISFCCLLMIWQMQWCQPEKHVPQKLSNFCR